MARTAWSFRPAGRKMGSGMRLRDRARPGRPAWLAVLLAVGWVLLAGAEVVVPALALVALVHVGGRLVAAARGAAVVSYPDLAVVIVVNAVVVLLVQLLLSIEGVA